MNLTRNQVATQQVVCMGDGCWFPFNGDADCGRADDLPPGFHAAALHMQHYFLFASAFI